MFTYIHTHVCIMANQNTAAHEQNRNKKIDILIIGAGLSGLTSALKIIQKEPSLQVRILEDSNRIGGQLTQVSLGEIGAKWISEDQCHIYRLLDTLNVQMHKRNILSPQLKAYRELDESLFSIFANYELERYINELELKLQLYNTVLAKSNEYSMYSHIHKRLFFNCSRKYMTNLVLLICGADAKTVRFKEFMAICYTCGGIKRLHALTIIAPNDSLFEFSSNDLLYQLLRSIKNTEIVCGRKAIEINQYSDFVEVRDSADEYHRAVAVILAVPLNCLRNMRFSPPLPVQLKITFRESSKKYIITSFLINYTEGYWRLKGFSGLFIKNEPILIAHEYRPTVYSGFMLHEEGIEPAVRSIVIHEFAKIFGEEMLLPQQFQQRSYELNSRNHMPLTTPWNRIIWSSSTATGTCYRGHLGGAVQSGLRAATNALLICRPQVVTWHDIVEMQCHNYHRAQDVTWATKLLSSCNLYNVSSYTLFICGLVLVLIKAYKRH